ncbi:hypothetical protein DASC09_045180 [Saccharomycopsis crataegensis]|uniref:Kinesin motor domain-containing protein n=1 Tax=Saccharomycopsis crataegensis TaxID=43959 RepID=A0AAV5QQW4_9ASCO|nr:hypothetical protein DASC09_045180 [Saccharomycopsis crataegensis]
MSKIELYLKLKAGKPPGQDLLRVVNESQIKENSIDVVSNNENNTKPGNRPTSYTKTQQQQQQQQQPLSTDSSVFSFDKVFNEQVSINQIYQEVLEQSIHDLIGLHNDTTFFNFGPPNCGKTHSLFGKSSNGLLGLSLKNIFQKIEQINGPDFDSAVYHEILGSHYGGLLLNANDIVEDPKKSSSNKPKPIAEQPSDRDNRSDDTNNNNTKRIISISMYEIYNDSVHDLLELTKDYTFLKKQIKKQVHKSTEIFDDAKDGKTKPSNIFTMSVSSFEQAMLLINSGLKNSNVLPISQSARSHLFVSVNVHAIDTSSKTTTKKKSAFNSATKGILTHDSVPGKQIKIKTSRLTFSMASSLERTRLSSNSGSRTSFSENNSNDQSLTDLCRVLAILNKSKNKTKEKYHLRSDKLSRLLLSDYIASPNNKMMILLNLDPYGNLNSINSALRLISPFPRARNSSTSGFNFNRSSSFNFKLGFRNRELKLAPSPTMSNHGKQVSRNSVSPTTSRNHRFSTHSPASINTRSPQSTVEGLTHVRESSNLSITPSHASTMATLPENESTVAFRRLSMIQKSSSPPSPISLRNTGYSASTKKKVSTSPLVESFTAAKVDRLPPSSSSHSPTSSPPLPPTPPPPPPPTEGPNIRHQSMVDKRNRQHSNGPIRSQSFPHKQQHNSISSSNYNSPTNSKNSSIISNSNSTTSTPGSSWPSVMTVSSSSSVVNNFIKSMDINTSDKSQILEKIVYRCQTLCDENAFLKGRNQLLEGKIHDLNNEQKSRVQQMAEDLTSSRLEIDALEVENKNHTDRIDELVKENYVLTKQHTASNKAKDTLIDELRSKNDDQEVQLSDTIKQLNAAKEEINYLKNELRSTNGDLEQIKHKFTVLAFQNHEYYQKYSQAKESLANMKLEGKTNSDSNSNSTIEAVTPKKTRFQKAREKINSFYFEEFSFNSTYNEESDISNIIEKDDYNHDENNHDENNDNDCEKYSMLSKDYLIEPYFNKDFGSGTHENSTSNSSMIFDFDDPRHEKNLATSASNSQYESESESHVKINFNLSSFSPAIKKASDDR